MGDYQYTPLKKEVHHKLKVQAVLEGKSMNEYLEELLELKSKDVKIHNEG